MDFYFELNYNRIRKKEEYDLNTLAISLLILGVCIFMLGEYQKKRQFALLQSKLQSAQYDEYFKILNQTLSKILFSKFTILVFSLNAYIASENHEKIDKTFQELQQMKCTKKQKNNIQLRAFHYYLEQRNDKKTKELIEQIKTWENNPAKEECIMLYEIMIEEKDTYLEPLLKKLEECDEFQKGYYEYLIALQYDNQKNSKMSDLYYRKSRQSIEHESRKILNRKNNTDE